MSAHAIYAAIRPMFPTLGVWDDVALEAAERALKAVAAHETAAGEDDARDAARYRWLRQNCTEGYMGYWNGGWSLNCDEPNSEWDAAIDAAIANTKGTK